MRPQQPGAVGGGEWWVHVVEAGKCVTVTQPVCFLPLSYKSF